MTRDGRPLSLTPKEFDTLLVLVEAAGKVLDKEELISRVWPDSYVGDGSLARNISVLRKALGEGVIETHRGRGYRIALPITATPAIATPEPLQVQEVATSLSARGSAVSKASRWRLGIVVASVTTVLLIVFTVFHFFRIPAATARNTTFNANPVHSVVIEKIGAVDPLDEGFKLVKALEPKYEHDVALYNRETNGWDRWRIRTDDQNFYYRPLSAAQKDFAMRRDWKLTCVCALEEGLGFADISFGPGGARYDMQFLQEGHQYFVALGQQISPKYQWAAKVEFHGVSDIAHPHTYELRFDHITQTAALWIDGRQMSSGYRGHHQFLDDSGVMFGAAIYGDAERGSFVFRTVRFEVH